MVEANTQRYIKTKTIKKRLTALLPILSLAVILIVFWWLKLTGITLAGEAFCGFDEHTHDEACVTRDLICEEDHEHSDDCYEVTTLCELEEHTHTSSCYSDINADLESAEIWEATLPEMSDELSVSDKVALIAQSQIGYTESELNFSADAEGIHHGYTRYGEWFGNPYGDWSTMFTAFCLRYAGLEDVPISAGADTMRIQWENAAIYRTKDNYLPTSGDVVFIDSNSTGSADKTAIVMCAVDGTLYVIEGDVNNTVNEAAYLISDDAVMGYGTVAPSRVPIMMNAAAPMASLPIVGSTTDYVSASLSSGQSFILYTIGSDGNYYAIDGNANAVRIYIDSSGTITSDVSNVSSIYWTFASANNYDNRPAYYIQNVSNNMYLHPYNNNATNRGVLLSGRYETALYTSGEGVKFRGARQSSYALLNGTSNFTISGTLNGGSTFYFGRAPKTCTVWFDGTNGGMATLSGSPDTPYTVTENSTMVLPLTWQTPPKYNYTLRGWFDVINKKYYAPGTSITVKGDMVFYADWEASTYDIGQYNAQTINTPSTNDFVTVNMFDYGILFNLLSEDVSVNVSASSHTETWSLLTSGKNPYNGNETLGFIFRDWDRGNEDISYPKNHNDVNNPTDSGKVYAGLYTDELGELFFSTENSFNPATGEGVIGKKHLGTADHLFQLMSDPNDEHYGYYYYDSDRNAASYNQSDGRFYVYDYLECAKDSLTSNDAVGKYSDFLPLNSPYANTNGKTVATYTYNGTYNEYVGTTHYVYDSKYSDNNNSPDRAGANYLFGMSVDLRFYLPVSPGILDENGEYGNRDVYGKDLHFKFSGDDDVWVFVDGKLVLDIGGIHGVESGDINFASGIVTVNGVQTNNIYNITPGEHVLTIYYLERGSSRANCAIYFNLAPRYSLELKKEDVLTQEKLDGTEFSIFTDSGCTIPAELWSSEDDYLNSLPSTNVFTVRDGKTSVWGFGASNTYYIKETKGPDAEGYSTSYGIIKLTINKQGKATYDIEISDEVSGAVSNGYTVHGFRIDEETQQVFMTVTNAPDWVQDTTLVQVTKKWNDKLDHTNDYVTVYLTTQDDDGTVRRIREAVLGAENNWTYTWTNLQKFKKDGVTPVIYNVEEAYFSGYTAEIEVLTGSLITETYWAESPTTFQSGETYILRTSQGYLSAAAYGTTSALTFLTEAEAKSTPLARWTATTNAGGDLLLRNEANHILTLNYGSLNSSQYFIATTNTYTNNYTYYQTMKFKTSGGGLVIYNNSRSRYIGGTFTSNNLAAVSEISSALVITPIAELEREVTVAIDGASFRITNTPIDKSNETSLTVFKEWDTGMLAGNDYEKLQVTMRLLANGVDTGRTVTLNLMNSWKSTFYGLPYKGADGNVITYTVVESWDNNDWQPYYSEIRQVDGDIVPNYEMTVTNVYRWGNGTKLPDTGYSGPLPMVLCGLGLMVLSLVCGCIMRRKRERRHEIH